MEKMVGNVKSVDGKERTIEEAEAENIVSVREQGQKDIHLIS